jgi:membrane peptidoglycan carboxypeptidase
MNAFTIDADNNITVHATKKAARETGAGAFDTAESLADLVGTDNKRLVGIWNSLTRVTPVKKFASRSVAARRIFAELQKLTPTAQSPGGPADDATEAAPAPAPARSAKKTPAKKTAEAAAKRVKASKPAGSGPRATSKTAQLIEMLRRPGGATLEEVMTYASHCTSLGRSEGFSFDQVSFR